MAARGTVRSSGADRTVPRRAGTETRRRGGDPSLAGVPAHLRAIAIWLLCLAPIAMLPGLNDRWGWPTLLCVVLAALLAVWVPPTGRLPVWLLVLIGAVAVVLIIGALSADAPIAQLFGRAPRYEGLVALPVLVAAGWAGARLLGTKTSAPALRHAVVSLATASVLLAVVGVLESMGLRPIDSDLLRPGSLAGNATDQAILGAIFAAVLGSVLIGTWRRTGRIVWWAGGGLVAGVVSVATSASRAGLLALGVVALALAVRFVARSPRRGRDGLIAVGAVVAAFFVAVAVPLTRDRLFGLGAFAQQTVADRFYMWDDAWRLFLSSPWLGVGPSGFADAITPHFGDEWFTRAQAGAILDSPHSIVLQAALVGGIPGVLAAALVVGGALVVGVRHARAASLAHRDLLIGALVAIPAAGVALLTHVTSPTTLAPLAMLVGLLVAVPPRGPTARSWVVAASVIGCVWLAFLLACTIADAALLDGRRAIMSGDLDRSVASFDTAQAFRPWDADVALVAAQSLGAAMDHGLAGAADPAAAWARRGAEALPSSSRAQYVAGMVALGRGEDDLAAGYLAKAAELSPADPRIHHELGVARLVGGDAAGARPALERAVELAPDSTSSWVALRDACAALGDDACVVRSEEGERDARVRER
ncbi:O-antigen ligase family protein [Microbacterium sp. BWT-B31]|uniref:O-antigen ligase family protein n=1 Tax=Microbacterium sp. BWT-B31 TaxID=3232072 RepID=UPI0035287287